ncbi:MAG: hypothetical protein L0Y43_03220, partial [Methylococcaceae bacterium]|nr:hypothetical protein [Methylococcaceae bacterium]
MKYSRECSSRPTSFSRLIGRAFRDCTALFLFCIAGCGQSEQLQSLSGFAQGTMWHVRYWSHEKTDPGIVKRSIETEFARLDRVLSNYRPDSVIETFNSRDDLHALTVG